MEVKINKIPHPFRKLNKNLIDSIIGDIKRGSTRKLASLSNGVTPRIFDIWRNQGELDVEHEVDSLCAYMVLSLSKVRQEEVISCIENIKISDKGHRGAEWILEHAYWREFGKDANIKELADELQKFKEEFKGVKKDGGEIHSESD
jgi:hypothetical protein